MGEPRDQIEKETNTGSENAVFQTRSARRIAFMFSWLPVAVVYWCMIHPAFGNGPPRLLPSFQGGPGISGWAGIAEIPGTVTRFSVWTAGVLWSLVVAFFVLFTSRFVGGVIATLLIRCYGTVSLPAMCFSGFSISILWLALLLAVFRPFAP